MRTFLLRITGFLGWMFLTAILLLGLEFFIVKNAGVKIDDSKNILVLGDSHTECAIDDNIIPRCANFSESGSTYFYSLLKLKEIIKSNKQVDTLLLSFHFGSLDKDNEKEFLFNEAYNFERLPKFIPFFTINDFLKYYDKVILVKSTLNSPVHYFPFILKGLVSGNYQTSSMKLGKFNVTERNKLKEDLQLRKEKGVFKLKTDYSEIELDLLFQINQVCKENQVKLILINTPVYHAEKYTDVSFYHQFQQKNSGKFTFLDLSAFNPGEEGFGDVSHLNTNGANSFSNYLNLQLSHSIQNK